MTKYLETPCPHDDCKAATLQQPVKNKNRFYTRCASCSRKSLYVIHDKTDGTQAYSVVRVGAPNRKMVRATFWIKTRHAEELEKRSILPRQKSQIVRDALDKLLSA